ncbi:MAG: hypothetical protein HC780_13310 [Leptolyngbyaceae cyanobacterium CSU_1_3]|nr:hypothetical protein [Leptolyngbyaceae cyanobacterium CSU_1_3]
MYFSVLNMIKRVSFVWTAIAIVGSLSACIKNPSGLPAQSNDQPEAQSASNLAYGNPIIRKNAEYIMIPVEVQTPQKREISFSSDSYESSSGQATFSNVGFELYSSGNINNVIFYNRADQKNHLLIDKKAAITSFYYPIEEPVEVKSQAKKNS